MNATLKNDSTISPGQSLGLASVWSFFGVAFTGSATSPALGFGPA